ncbi:MAG: hypothetical protein WD397_05245 [Wenzhouxiangellaceae bacterium]
MKHRDNRIESIFEQDEESDRHQDDDPAPFDLEPEPASIHPAIQFAAIAVVVACLFFVGDRLYTRYQERQAIKALEQALEDLGAYMNDGLEQAGAAMEQISQQARVRNAAAAEHQRERIDQQHRARMATTEGGWLAKNCADWTRAWEEMKAPTAEREMNKHCGQLERYLETGIAPPGTPRAVNPER